MVSEQPCFNATAVQDIIIPVPNFINRHEDSECWCTTIMPDFQMFENYLERREIKNGDGVE